MLLEGLAFPESPRWHDDRLWLSGWGTDEIVAVDLEGNKEVVGRGAGGLGWAVNWLPDRRMLISGSELMRVEPDDTRVRHADLSAVSSHGWSELTVDGRGNAYVNTINFDFADFEAVLSSKQAPGKIALVRPPKTAPCPTAESGPTASVRTASVSTPTGASGRPATPRRTTAPASARVARSSTPSSWTARALQRCSAARSAGRCS